MTDEVEARDGDPRMKKKGWSWHSSSACLGAKTEKAP